jgi:hypothetical protein
MAWVHIKIEGVVWVDTKEPDEALNIVGEKVDDAFVISNLTHDDSCPPDGETTCPDCKGKVPWKDMVAYDAGSGPSWDADWYYTCKHCWKKMEG